MVRCVLLDAIDPSLNPPFGKLFFSLFKSHIASERQLFSIKMKEIIKKLTIKYQVGLGDRKGFIDPIRWHPFNNLN